MNKITKRTRQFLRALTAKMKPADHALVHCWLDKTEELLFYDMDVAIQLHSINVARTLEKLLAGETVDKSLLFRAALLHDIGKVKGQFTVLDRVWYVLVRKVSRRLVRKIAKKGSSSWLGKLRNAFYIHIYHGELGAQLVLREGLCGELADLIRHHHDPARQSDSLELSLLRQADELN